MSGGDELDGGHIVLSPSILVGIICGAAGIGAGGLSFVSPTLEREALQKCFDQSAIALSVAEQHGGELQQIRRLIEERTRDRYTATQSEADKRQQRRVDEIQDKRINFLERNHEP